MEILLIILDFWSPNITDGLDIVCFGFDLKIMQKSDDFENHKT